MRNMNSLYSVTTIYNEKNFIRFYDELMASSAKESIINTNFWLIVYCVFAFSLESSAFFENGRFPCFTIFFILLLLFEDYRYFFRRNSSYKYEDIYLSMKMLQNEEVKYEFFENEFIVTDKYGSTKIPFEMIYEIKETKWQYIILTSKVSGYYIEKSEAVDGFADYILQIKTKYSK